MPQGAGDGQGLTARSQERRLGRLMAARPRSPLSAAPHAIEVVACAEDAWPCLVHAGRP